MDNQLTCNYGDTRLTLISKILLFWLFYRWFH